MKMFKSTNFERRMFSVTINNNLSIPKGEKSKPIENEDNNEVDDKYEEAIKTLNTLQSNAETIRRSILVNNKRMPLDDTIKFLERSGLSLQDLDKLSFIHVSGTKGKGSTCALTDAILHAHGLKTGFFSSPHLVSVTERIRINGQQIEKQKFTRSFWRVFKRLQALQSDPADMPGYFKFLTILCFHIFLEEKVDVVLLEVGIGGELDSTNIIRNTKTVGITSLGLEHTQLLGDTIEEIAWQKAGIIKQNSNVFTSVNQPECLKVIKQRAQEKNATLYIVPDFAKYIEDNKLITKLATLNNITKLNGSLAIQLAFDWLVHNKNGFHKNYAVNSTKLPNNVLNAIINCNLPGRCQTVNYYNFKIHFDGAHTVESINVCSDWFSDITKNENNPKVLIFNTTGDRDSKKLLSILHSKAKFSTICFVPNFASKNCYKNDIQSSFGFKSQIDRAHMHATLWRSLDMETSEQNAKDNNIYVFETILDSFQFIAKHYGQLQLIDVLVTGSIHLIGATVLALNEYKTKLQA